MKTKNPHKTLTIMFEDRPYCKKCYDSVHATLCDDCYEEVKVCLNCLAYGEGGLCLNCINDSDNDEGVDLLADKQTIIQDMLAWIHNNNMHWMLLGNALLTST